MSARCGKLYIKILKNYDKQTLANTPITISKRMLTLLCASLLVVEMQSIKMLDPA